jgi:tetratricopeptide (TPR) repeat protein
MRIIGIFLLLLLLPFGNAYLLSWKEFIRLGVIALLGTCYVCLGKRTQQLSKFYLSSVSTILFYFILLFIITQFDPLLNPTKYSDLSSFPQYWFLICSSVLILWGFGETHLFLRRIEDNVISSPYKNIDSIIAFISALVIILFLVTKWVYRFQTNYIVLVKIIEYGVLWFVVSRLADVVFAKGDFPQIDVGGKLIKYRRFCRLDSITLGIFFIIFLLGMLRMGGSIYNSHKGQALLRSGNVEGAISHYNKWFTVNQLLEFWTEQPLVDFSVLLMREADGVRFEKALTVLRRIQTNQYQIHRKIGEVWFRGGNWKKAIKEFEILLEEKTADEEVRKKLAICYIREGYQRRFLNLVKNGGVPNILPEDYETSLSLGRVHFYSKEFEQATNFFRKASEFHFGNDSFVQYELGRSLLAAGKAREAQVYFENSLKLEPDFADCYFQLGKCYDILGEDELARNSFKQALCLVPNHLEALSAIENGSEVGANNRGNLAEGKWIPENWTTTEFGDVEMLGYSLKRSQGGRYLDATFFWKLTGTIPPTSNRFLFFIFDETTGNTLVNEGPFFKKLPAMWRIGEVVKESYSLPVGEGRILDQGEKYKMVVYLLFPPDSVEETIHAWFKSDQFIVNNIVF